MSALEQLPTRITVEAPARLHFGVLDLRGHLGRRFGGIGAAIPVPAVRLEVTRNESITAEGPDAGRALEFARRFLASYRLKGGAHLCVAQTIPLTSDSAPALSSAWLWAAPSPSYTAFRSNHRRWPVP